MMLRNLLLIAVLSGGIVSTAPVYSMDPTLPNPNDPLVQATFHKCLEVLQRLGTSGAVIIQVILSEVGPKAAEVVKHLLRMAGYPV